ncbi:hypothetical protein ADIARSV_0190 [Arcticibacter svalbardensis MN12-7]|uniref:Uncharacterized protein n=1 Tax=Arcticibacter svalbardensis MN12-7 TaxID=1150600 RepID=R9H5W8_9SPHI|nr:hypothetical protein [Arcticibacter svalbardensis]EOR96559.1 hypothetical protein ADIARSV_0190 [Arcticibacter svalbardensis MN12-7]
MTVSDQSFRDEFKPLYIPSSFHQEDTQENKIVFALAQIGDGDTDEIASKLEELEPGSSTPEMTAFMEAVLSGLFNKGLLKGVEQNGKMRYNLSKITKANDGEINPDLLTPGLD